MPFPASAGKDLFLSEENNDLSILSVRESTSSEYDPTERILSEETNLQSGELSRTCSRTRRTMERQNCLLMQLCIILGDYVIIYSTYVIIFGD